ncbi:MAG: hypothetical protein NXI32_28145 [bacterium]|nr:hypothetical protein [bacterium]
MGNSPSGAMYGYFRIRRDDCMLDIISSGESHGDGIEAWEHVSVSVYRKRQTPTWSQMCQIKNLFWGKDETVIQFHPPEVNYVSFHDFCLHLWKPPYELALPHQTTLGPVTGSRILSR